MNYNKEYIKLYKSLEKNPNFEDHFKFLYSKWKDKKNSQKELRFISDVENQFMELKQIPKNKLLLKYGVHHIIIPFCNKYFEILNFSIENDLTLENIMNFSDPSVALKKLLTESDLFTDSEFWSYLKDIYVSLQSNIELLPLLKTVFTSNRGSKEFLMSIEERNLLDSLPSEIEIYRGMTKKESKSKNYGISWTIKKEVAESFANTYLDIQFGNKDKLVISKIIPKNEVIAYFNCRNEDEIIWIQHK